MARYADFNYTWYPETQRFRGRGHANLYIKTPDGQVFYLPELTPEDAGGKIGWKDEPLTKKDKRLFKDGSSSLRFENGSLTSFDLYNYNVPGKTTFLFSLSEEGPFAPMPKTTEELVALFGEPVEWDRYHPPTSP